MADYGSQLQHFFRTSEFVDDLEHTIDGEDLGFANAGDEWDEETQDILDSEEDEADYGIFTFYQLTFFFVKEEFDTYYELINSKE